MRKQSSNATFDAIDRALLEVLQVDARLTNLILQRFMAKPVSGDLIHVANQWFGNRRAKQKLTSQMMNDLGEVTTLKLPRVAANGTW